MGVKWLDGVPAPKRCLVAPYSPTHAGKKVFVNLWLLSYDSLTYTRDWRRGHIPYAKLAFSD